MSAGNLLPHSILPARACQPLAAYPQLSQPLQASTQIAYHLATPGPVRLTIYNILGQPMRTLMHLVVADGKVAVIDPSEKLLRLASLHEIGGKNPQVDIVVYVR